MGKIRNITMTLVYISPNFRLLQRLSEGVTRDNQLYEMKLKEKETRDHSNPPPH